MMNTTQVVDTIFVFNKSIICQVSQRDILKTVLNIFVEYLKRNNMQRCYSCYSKAVCVLFPPSGNQAPLLREINGLLLQICLKFLSNL